MARNTARATTEAGEGNPAHGDENPKRGVELGMQNSEDNPWKLESSDQPGMVLISAVLTGNNYHFWSRFMTIALGAKGKLGFVNGEIEAPDEHSPNYRQWKQTDCMVFCWILNSLSKEIMEASIYANTAKDLWNDLEQRYGGWNLPLILLKRREIANCRQGSDSLTVYFTKFEKLWNELGNLTPWHRGNCGAMRNDMTNKLMQFLMGLNECFDATREQILLMDPLPSVYRAYSAMLLVEKPMSGQQFVVEPVENAADVKVQGKEKMKLQCDHCNDPGHEMSDCFKLHGYPDWYKNRKERKGGQNSRFK